jgi:acetyl-CoA carboxylase carboxyl transferase subunit alpha
MGVSAPQIKELGLINDIIAEPLGGAHRNHKQMAANFKATIKQQLSELQALSLDELKAQRYARLMSFGYC